MKFVQHETQNNTLVSYYDSIKILNYNEIMNITP